MIADWLFLVGSISFLSGLVVVAYRALDEAFEIIESERNDSK
tara:strand:- start:260 stop:385 length:126 start_codon:yes stop_codon:yes gene_type:complete